jgi:hypothetical protein
MNVQTQQHTGVMMGGDPLVNLPVDKEKPSEQEAQIIQNLFVTHRSTMDVILAEAKDSLIIGLLFLILSLPIVDSLIQRFIPFASKSVYILVAFKAIVLMVLYWIIKHFYLSRQSV